MKLFAGDIDKGIKNPIDYFYLKFLRLNLLCLNTWPAKEMGGKQLQYGIMITITHIILKASYFICGIFYMTENVSKLSFYEMGHTYVMMFMSFVALSRIFMVSLSQKCKDVIAVFLTKMHLFYYKGGSAYAVKVHKQVHFISCVFSIWFIFQWVSGVISFNTVPMYRNFASGKYKERNLINSTYEHSIYLLLPIDVYQNFNGYIFMFILNWIDSFVCTAWFIVFDLALSLMVFNLWGHYKILLHDLGSFPLPAKEDLILADNTLVHAEIYSKEEQEEVTKKLKECIDYHRLIADFTNELSDAFGPMLFIYYAFHQAVGCLLLLECSQMTTQAWVCYGPLALIIFQQLIQVSVIFELIVSKSEKLKDAVYGVPWECMNIANRKTVTIFLINVQEPISVKALGLAQVGVTTMAAILKTSLTYFTFLRSM